ncbi:phage minor head protein [Nitrosomonas sp. Nm33]|uniref:phage head morphogenesis protein n=1 Tax=Nitrosomonas sp. Nm33 TaxID=133724 RepID=UPI00089AC2D9|nr:phage minor head protein [Nitrosomonas sp. Nm33]SDY44882.1 Phage Mu protein F like protein [Nitrosomonas sp. Nm33]
MATHSKNKNTFPYLKYDANNSEHSRLEHSAWDGLVLPVDDPFWKAHYPAKAWGCKCGVTQLDEDTLDELGLKPSEPPEEETYTYINKRTGEVQRIPKEADPSFNYPPGGAWRISER